MMTAEHPVKLSGPTQLSAKYPSLRHDLIKRCNESLQWVFAITKQEVVTYMLPVAGADPEIEEAIATGIKVFDQLKVCLITWSFPSEALDCVIFKESKIKLQPHIICWFVDFTKGLWSLDSILIPVTNASTQDIQVSTPCTVQIQMNCSANRPDSRTGFTEEVMHPVWVGTCRYYFQS